MKAIKMSERKTLKMCHRCVITIKDFSHSNLFGTIKSLVIKAALLTYVVHKLRKEVSKCFNTEDYVDLSYNFHLKLRLLIP